MGIRYRKSIRIGKGFRINLSKSGIGYSVGCKGLRYTKTASDRSRTTVSIPGTGISWVEESSGNRTQRANPSQPTPNNGPAGDTTYLYSVENADAAQLTSSSLEAFIKSIRRFHYANLLLSLTFIFILVLLSYGESRDNTALFGIGFMLTIAAIALMLVHLTAGRIKAEYVFDDFSRMKYETLLQAMETLRSNQKVWQLTSVYANQRSRVHGGASQSLDKVPVTIKRKTPYFLRMNVTCYQIKLKKEMLYILPDQIIVKNGSKFGAIAFSELQFEIGTENVIDTAAPKDAYVVSKTWRYVNKDGTPDRRFSNNVQLPVCLYAAVSVRSGSGFNTKLYLSNHQTGTRLEGLIGQMRSGQDVPHV